MSVGGGGKKSKLIKMCGGYIQQQKTQLNDGVNGENFVRARRDFSRQGREGGRARRWKGEGGREG